MYVAAKGGVAAIEASWQLLAEARRGDPALPALSVAQIRSQLRGAVDRVMSEGSLFDAELAALAIKQAAGDLVEAIFLLRAYRTTLPRFGYSLPLDTGAMHAVRRISATFKDVPGGQVLGPTHDYTQRLLDFALLAEGPGGAAAAARGMDATKATTATAATGIAAAMGAPIADTLDGAPGDGPRHRPHDIPPEPLPYPLPRVNTLMAREGLMEAQAPEAGEPGDLTRDPLLFPADRALRLQALARADEGWLLGLGYSTQRGYANAHPFAGEIRRGEVAVELVPDELGFAIDIGDIELTECTMVNQFHGSRDRPPQFTQGYGLAMGGAERKAIAMALVDRALRAEELGEPLVAPAQDQEFALAHGDSLDASGFVQHLKLPHHVDFQSELELVRRLRAEHGEGPHG